MPQGEDVRRLHALGPFGCQVGVGGNPSVDAVRETDAEFAGERVDVLEGAPREAGVAHLDRERIGIGVRLAQDLGGASVGHAIR